jgi:hypothetical protein
LSRQLHQSEPSVPDTMRSGGNEYWFVKSLHRRWIESCAEQALSSSELYKGQRNPVTDKDDTEFASSMIAHHAMAMEVV